MCRSFRGVPSGHRPHLPVHGELHWRHRHAPVQGEALPDPQPRSGLLPVRGVHAAHGGRSRARLRPHAHAIHGKDRVHK